MDYMQGCVINVHRMLRFSKSLLYQKEVYVFPAFRKTRRETPCVRACVRACVRVLLIHINTPCNS